MLIEPALHNRTWIEAGAWDHIQQMLPILCVDILPIQTDPLDGSLRRVGLILRETPLEGRKWCTVGGRLQYGENLAVGIARQIRDTLGTGAIAVAPVDVSQPLYVAQYAPAAAAMPGFDAADPRKHAIGLTYTVELAGELEPMGEALDFRWFQWYDMPKSEDIGFLQDGIIRACLQRWPGNMGQTAWSGLLDDGA